MTNCPARSKRFHCRHPGSLALRWISSLLLTCGSLGCGPSSPPQHAEPATTRNLLSELSQASQRVSQAASTAVVKIEADAGAAGPSSVDELSQLFGSAASPAPAGQGSGVIVDPEGFVLTNYHVIGTAARIRVTVSPQRVLEARVVGVDALTDLALLKIDARDLPAIPWGDSDRLSVGAFVWAVGSPYALERSVSFGIVSAKDREGWTASPFQEFLQTDAAVNPGNSGGPLVDVDGRLVGINTAILGQAYQGISFAIPGNTVREVYERLRAGGRVPRGWLGVALDVVTPQRAVQLNLPTPEGALVVSVVQGKDPSPAQLAGIRAGDVIVRWNDQPIDNPVRLSRLVAQSEIGQPAAATVFRAGSQQTFPITVRERPGP